MRVPKWFGPEMNGQSTFEFTGRQFTIRLTGFALGMDPARFDRVQPGTFLRQQKSQQARLASLFGGMIVGSDPLTEPLTLMPGGSVPNHDYDTDFGLAR